MEMILRMSPNDEIQLKKAVGIVRRSDLKQKGNASLETQSEAIRTKAINEGYHIVKIFTDDANSAYHKVVTKRQAMNDLLETVLTENEIEAVLFYEESRLSRKIYDFPLFVHDVIKRERPQIKFFSTSRSGEWDAYDIVSVINFATAANESVKKSSRAKDGQKISLGKLNRPGSDVPYGYKLIFPEDESDKETSSKKIIGEQILNSNQATIVLFIFFLASWGHSQEKIAKLLNDANIPSPKNKEWSSGTIDYILDNDQYLGHLPWNIRSHLNTSRKKQRGEYDLIFNHHEPIISIPLWNITHQTIELHKSKGKNNNTQFYLRGVLYCQNCNEELISKNETPQNSKKEYLVYRCPSCKHKLKIEEIHNEIINELSSKWYMTLTQMGENISKLLAKRKIKIENHRNSIKEQLKQIEFKEEFLLNSPEQVKGNDNWDFILSISKSKNKRELFKANSFIEHIELLEQGLHSNRMFSLLEQFDINHLLSAELRTIFLTLYKKINVDFENGKLLFVEYKLAPFTEIDRYFESI